MHTCISSYGLKRSWRSCPRWVNAGNKNTPSTHHPRRRNVTTLMVGLKNGHICKSHPKVVNPRDIAGKRKKTKQNKTKNPHKVVLFLASWERGRRFVHTSNLTPNSTENVCTCGFHCHPSWLKKYVYRKMIVHIAEVCLLVGRLTS